MCCCFYLFMTSLIFAVLIPQVQQICVWIPLFSFLSVAQHSHYDVLACSPVIWVSLNHSAILPNQLFPLHSLFHPDHFTHKMFNFYLTCPPVCIYPPTCALEYKSHHIVMHWKSHPGAAYCFWN